MDFFRRLFDSEFMPHGHCYQWLPEILWLHVISDTLIALSYASIPISLAIFVKKRKDLEFKSIFLLFGAFILCCGATHMLEIYAVWEGAYRLTGLVKAITAVVSVATAGALIPLIPKALQLPSPKELVEANQRLLLETEHRLKAEKELAQQQREKLFMSIVEATPNGVILVNNKGVIVLANKAAENIFGYDPDELLEKEIHQLVEDNFHEKHRAMVDIFLKDGTRKNVLAGRELKGRTKDSKPVYVEVGLTPVEWHEQSFTLASIVDMTERKQQAQEIEEGNLRFNRAIEGASDGLWEWNLQLNQFWYAPQFFNLLGFEPKRAQEERDMSFWLSKVHPQEQALISDRLNSISKEDESFKVEHRIKSKDGTYRWFLSKGKHFEHQNAQFVSGSITDIHESKLTKAKQEEQNQFLDSIFRGVRHGIFVLEVTEDKDFIFEAYNPSIVEQSGINFEEIEGKPIEAMVPKYLSEEVAGAIRGNYQRCLDQGDRYEYVENVPISGQDKWWMTCLNPIRNLDGEITRIIGSTTEITQMKHMESKLRQREEYSRKIIDYSLNGLYIFNLVHQKNTFINPSYTRITGYTLEDVTADDMDFMALFHPEDLEVVQNHLKEVLSAKTGTSVSLEYRFRHKQGHWIWCWSNDAVFTRNDKGEPEEMIGTFIDISSIKNANQRLLESNRELEQFAFIASHDLREPLRKVSSFGKLLQSRFSKELNPKAQDYIRRMVSATHRMDSLVADLLTLSRITSQGKPFEKENLNDILSTVLTDLETQIEETGAIIQSGKLPFVFCDKGQVYQLFLNLIGNALKYRKPDVQPLIKISSKKVSSSYFELTFSDNGIGFKQEYASQIFGIFKRLHSSEEYSGSGIGLSICKKIVERHEGKIWAYSEPGTGSIFKLTFQVTGPQKE